MKSTTTHLALALSASGQLYLDTRSIVQEILTEKIADKIHTFFSDNVILGLLRLGLTDFTDQLPSSFIFWQHFSQRFITEICKHATDPEIIAIAPILSETESQEFLKNAPFFTGIEYLNSEVLTNLWHALQSALSNELINTKKNLQEYLSTYNTNWNLIGRVCFHLAENKQNEEKPFAFLATYTTRLTNRSAQHLPLGRALEEYAGEKNKPALLALLLPIQKAATQSHVIKELVDSRDIFQPQAWSVNEAYRFLKDVPLFESAGVIVRVPNWWNSKKPPRPQISISIGEKKAGLLGLNALLDFDMQIALANGDKISPDEWKAILASTEHLIKVKGQWVEVDPEKLKEVLTHWKKIQKNFKEEGLTFGEGMRLLAGAQTGKSDAENEFATVAAEWSHVTAGAWLNETLAHLQSPEQSCDKTLLPVLKKYLHATLRPYQMAGVSWLWLLYNLKLGGCLADDMGLGKTIQVLSLLLLAKHLQQPKNPHLLIIPASLIGNWQAEIARFSPDLNILIAHSSVDKNHVKEINAASLTKIDLVITTYSFAHRLTWIKEIEWDILILDEAQMIKNPDAKQTRTIKTFKSKVRFTLTGTPIENRLSDLWSLFDFTAPGLLGSSRVFSQYSKKENKDADAQNDSKFYSAIRTLVSPYILRRLKSDKKIISDLPDKTELQAYCILSKQQTGLYQQAVEELHQQLQISNGIQRRGIVLAFLLRFKQICNHPAQWLGHGGYESEASGKFLRLKEICEEISAKQEKVLVFTQFREIIPALTEFLTKIFERPGLVLHGSTAIKQRSKLVEEFQQESGPPFFVLSLKAGGTGLNLTNAAHVIHFDRWWNPAVENQATDRAYRIGQKKNVLVHKFICRGTIEERIDTLIASKQSLSHEILSGKNEILLTELTNEDLMKIVSLDIHQTMNA